MCGIVGYIGKEDAVPVLVDGLKRLEYRGYDSAGIAIIEKNGTLSVRRNAGKIRDLEQVIFKKPLSGNIGIGHTRWATHGRPSEENAHPHRDCKGEIVVVHNGIIENYAELKKILVKEGHSFKTETDTEVVAHLVEKHRAISENLFEAVRSATKELDGHYAVAVISAEEPSALIAAKNGPPLVIGFGENANYVASDILALLPYTKKVVFLEDGEIAEVKENSVRHERSDGTSVHTEPTVILWDPIMAEKGGHKHFMLKEIHEQPSAVRETLAGRINLETGEVYLSEAGLDENFLKNAERVHIVACGTSLHAGLVGKQYIETLARVPCETDYASEYRYRAPIVGERTLVVAISQSGETADTLAAMGEAEKRGAKIISICNVRGSSIARKSDGVIYTNAGPEIGVASTKAFTSQLTALYLFALYLGDVRKTISREQMKKEVSALARLSHAMENYLAQTSAVEEIAKEYHTYRDFLYLGRGLNYPLALEGALKLKEISYIHAEGYPGGEMKHGPIALVDEKFPTLALVFDDITRSKMMGNIEEIKARGGRVIALTYEDDSLGAAKADAHLTVPRVEPLLTPIIAALPLQLFAYHIAVILGCDVDQPRNLAKSVTVE